MNIKGVKHLISSLAVVSLMAYSQLGTTSNPSADAVRQMNSIAQEYEQKYFANFPETALFWGKMDVDHSRFSDHSYAAVKEWEHYEDRIIEQLNQIDEPGLKNTPQHITYQTLKQYLTRNVKARVCKDQLWNVNPALWGWLTLAVQVADKQPVGTDEYRTLALTRWNTFPNLVNQEIDKLKTGLSEGYTAPKSAVLSVVKQVRILLDATTEESPFFNFADHDGTPAFKEQVIQLINQKINPSLKKYADYLEHDYLPFARDEIGVSALPNGAACYQAKIEQFTTLNMTPTQIHQLGLNHMKELTEEVAIIGKKEFNLTDMTQVFYEAKTRPVYLFHSEQDMLHYNFVASERAKAKSLAWFKEIPKAEGVIRPYPEFRAKTGAVGEYSPPSNDGSIPGIYYINTYNATNRSRIDQEATVFHELVPGHHFQIALSYENTTQLNLNKYLWNSGFIEGWGLYVERLADEMGLYSDDISRLGMLSNESLRTARLVVDTGIHQFHWTRAQAISYLQQHSALSDHLIEGEVDRYTMNPGQANAYMLGKYQIERVRDLAKTELKTQFDIREFHYQVLKNGAVTLPMLEEKIHEWIEQTKE